MLLALKMQEGATDQGNRQLSEAGKDKEMNSPLDSPERIAALDSIFEF